MARAQRWVHESTIPAMRFRAGAASAKSDRTAIRTRLSACKNGKNDGLADAPTVGRKKRKESVYLNSISTRTHLRERTK